MVRVPSREATEEELRRVHTEAHVDRVFAFEDPMVAERAVKRDANDVRHSISVGEIRLNVAWVGRPAN